MVSHPCCISGRTGFKSNQMSDCNVKLFVGGRQGSNLIACVDSQVSMASLLGWLFPDVRLHKVSPWCIWMTTMPSISAMGAGLSPSTGSLSVLCVFTYTLLSLLWIVQKWRCHSRTCICTGNTVIRVKKTYWTLQTAVTCWFWKCAFASWV